MKTRLSIIALFWLATVAAYSQGMATLTGTVTDSDAINWASAQVTFQLNVPGGGTPINKLTGAVVPNFVPQTLTTPGGAFTGTNQITRTDDIIPNGATWTAQVCSLTSAPCQSFANISIAAASFNMGTYLSSRISAPRFPDPVSAWGYSTLEVTTKNPGAVLLLYPAKTCNFWNTTAWAACTATTTVPGGTTPAIQYNNSGAFGGLGIATRGALQESGTGVNFYSPTYAALVTDPPYNAACDGATDDTAAIQAAINNNAAIQLPLGNSQCNVTTLQQNTASLTIYGNGGILFSRTNASMLTLNPANTGAILNLVGLNFDFTPATNTICDIDITHYGFVYLNNFVDFSGFCTLFTSAGNASIISVENSSLNNVNVSGLGTFLLVNSTMGQGLGTNNSTIQADNINLNFSAYNNPNLTVSNSGYVNIIASGATGHGTSIQTFTANNVISLTGSISAVSTAISSINSGVFCINTTCTTYSPLSLFNNSTATTQAVNDNSTKVATTAYVDRVALSAPTCNVNGCYFQYSDGTIHAWGKSSTVAGTPVQTNVTFTYPVTFVSAPDPVVTAVSDATGGGAPCTGSVCSVSCHVIKTSESTTGATGNIGLVVTVGGSGFANLATGDYCAWTADGK